MYMYGNFGAYITKWTIGLVCCCTTKCDWYDKIDDNIELRNGNNIVVCVHAHLISIEFTCTSVESAI